MKSFGGGEHSLKGGAEIAKLLFDEQPIVVDRLLAKIIGLNEAVVIQQVHYWLELNKKEKRNFNDGHYWTYNSLVKWQEDQFSFWSIDTVKRTFAKLENMGLLISGNYNKDSRDRTKWYTIDYLKLEAIYAKCISAKCTNGKVQSAPMQPVNLPQPLPENNIQRLTTENKQQRQDVQEIKGEGRRSFRGNKEEKREPDQGDVEELTNQFVQELGIEYSQAEGTAKSLLKHFELERIATKIPCAVGQKFTRGLGAFLRVAIGEDWPVPVKKTVEKDLKKGVIGGKYKDIYMS